MSCNENLFLKVGSKNLARTGRHVNKILCEDLLGQLESPTMVKRNFEQRGVKFLILVFMNCCSEK